LQRVAIALCLSTEADLYLMDEPSAYLDVEQRLVVAKVIRDDYMVKIDKFYPQYNWKSNKGYGSKEHIEKILSEGTTPHHRKSFLKKILS